MANQAILKLFTLEQWIKDHVPKECDLTERAAYSLDDWDILILNKLKDINVHVYKAYVEMKFRNVVKYGFNEMLSLKETYIIGKQGEPNPYVIMTYLIY